MTFETGSTSYKLSFSFIAFAVLMMLICDDEIVFLSLGSSVVHESGHLFFIFLVGDKPKTVELTLFGMRIDRAECSEFSYIKEALIASGGIIFNLIFALSCYIIYQVSKSEIFIMLTVVNVIILLINSVPVSVLDFGRVLKCIFLLHFENEKCERILGYISYIFVGFFSVFTIFYCVFIGVNFSLIAVTLYIFSITVIKKWS